MVFCFCDQLLLLYFQTARDHMPWAPHIHPLLKNKVSVLNRLVDHQRYVAIASNFLNPEPLLRYQHNRKELQVMFFYNSYSCI